ncbi:hypothetical protein A2819_00210 [Candidatus Azambacteria bacterium RIFCSPHIGHO2_01_FULL_40_24]|uniref:DUF4878 domain-containing protein n=1 Tax=Candidatus Azambacteria bacterium RIFCSPHIGHO2_01_FULL_40_24 TaxID=1797301 RepID=A0A1F5B3V4_9BACT|nr:MAG: hypothetical protein A2819_00210 [Candidatus Azambacteria bacterium RIFCSPHIGHO2_01_FULL_40_24]
MKFGEPEASQDKASPVGLSAEDLAKAEGGASQGEENNQAAPKAPRNRKLIWAGIIVAALILAVIGWQYWQYMQSPYYQQMRAVKMIEAQQKESDKWGGKTPEETVRLFTEAIKKGDFELASKYGREEIKSELEKMKTAGQMNLLMRELETGKIVMFDNRYDADLRTDIDGVKVRVLSMHKSDGGTWKIDEF